MSEMTANASSIRSGVSVRLLSGMGILATLLVVAALISLTMGPVEISVLNVTSILLSNVGLDLIPFTVSEELIVEELRLPRILVGAIVGMALGVAGTTMQAVFRNPMAEPGIIGVSAGGAVGAVLSITFGLNDLFFLALPLFAFIGSMGSALLVYGIALMGGYFSISTLLLAGVAVSAFLAAIVSLVIVLVPNNEGLREILFWLAGGLDSRSWEHVQISFPIILSGCLVIVGMSRELNLLMLGNDDARSLGVRIALVRPVLIIISALITGVAVAVSGTIAFVGLVVPHTLRLVFGPDHRVLLPMSAVGGALFLVLADTMARMIAQPAEIRVGIVTAFFGAPFFVGLLILNRKHTGVL